MPLLTIQNKAVCSPHEVFRLPTVVSAKKCLKCKTKCHKCKKNVLSLKQNVLSAKQNVLSVKQNVLI